MPVDGTEIELGHGFPLAILFTIAGCPKLPDRLRQRDMRPSFPTTVNRWQRDLSVSHRKLAIVFEGMGESAKALDSLQQGRAIMARLAGLTPGNTQWKRDLAAIDEQIARLER